MAGPHPDIHRVLGLLHPTLHELEEALGIELSQPHQPHGHFVEWRTGRGAWQAELDAAPTGYTITPKPDSDGFHVLWRTPPPPPFDTEQRGYWIGDLTRALRKIDAMREFRELVAAMPTDIGVTQHGPTTFAFHPPVNFGLFVDALEMGPYDLKSDVSDYSYVPSWIDRGHGRWRIYSRIDPRDNGLRVVTITPYKLG